MEMVVDFPGGARVDPVAIGRHRPAPRPATPGTKRARSGMSSAGTVGRDETVRLFLALRLPDDVLDELDRWGAAHLRDGRRVVREHLHVTLAFLGRQPEEGVARALEALRGASARTAPFPLAPVRWRETRSVGMVVLSDESGDARRLAADLHDRLEASGVYRRGQRKYCQL